MSTMAIHEVDQGTPEWHALRCGLLTASEVKLIMTPTLKKANNDKSRAHVYELLAQRITGHVEPHYIGDDMLRGYDDEVKARALYSEKYAPVQEVGFITRCFPSGLVIGYSPDGLVGEDGQIECKSRRQKFQVQTVLESFECPEEYLLQIQTGLIVTGRAFCDFISYSGGLPMVVLRVEADPVIQRAILEAAEALEETLASMRELFERRIETQGWHPTERTSDDMAITAGEECVF